VLHDPKAAAAMIVSRMKGPPPAPEGGDNMDGGNDAPEDAEGAPSEGLHAAASQMIDAMKAGDAGALASALRSAFQMLDAGDDQ
jgi:hypothetical protein